MKWRLEKDPAVPNRVGDLIIAYGGHGWWVTPRFSGPGFHPHGPQIVRKAKAWVDANGGVQRGGRRTLYGARMACVAGRAKHVAKREGVR